MTGTSYRIAAGLIAATVQVAAAAQSGLTTPNTIGAAAIIAGLAVWRVYDRRLERERQARLDDLREQLERQRSRSDRRQRSTPNHPNHRAED